MKSIATTVLLVFSILFFSEQGFCTPHHYHKHNLALRSRHAKLHQQHADFDLDGRSARSTVSEHVSTNHRRDTNEKTTGQLESEMTTFNTWMTDFFQGPDAKNTPEAVCKVKEELVDHLSSVEFFISGASAAQSIDAVNLSALQNQVMAFDLWTNAWMQSAPNVTKEEASSVLQTEVTAYQGWMKQWIKNVAGSAPPTSDSASTGSSGSGNNGSNNKTSDTPPPPSPLNLPNPNKHDGQEQLMTPKSSPFSTSTTPGHLPPLVAHSTSTVTYSVQEATPTPTVSIVNSSSYGGSGPGNSPLPSSTGEPRKLRQAAWWGQSPAASSKSLQDVCSDPNFDIIILGFVNNYFEPNGMPTLNLGPATGSVSKAQAAVGAEGLFDGSDVVPAIKSCQSSGKKVMLSLGGATASGSAHSGTGLPTSVFPDDNQAIDFANTLWQLFLGGKQYSDLRPFGDVKLDGIDVDSEAGDTNGYTAFTTALRSKFAEDTSKQYFISAAPQCPLPDESIPLDAMNEMDFIWVQFYNNGNCNHGSAGFNESVRNWSKNLSGNNAEFFIAALATQGPGYIDPSSLATEVENVKAMNLPNFGGYALWDSSEAIENDNMQATLKKALDA